MKGKRAVDIAVTAVFIIALIIFVLTFSIGVPIYCRFLYYWQIKTLDMEARTGWDYQTIKQAYDEVLNYLTLPGRQFGTGALKFSADGAAHFADCKVLFNLNFFGMLGSAIVAAAIIILQKFKVVTLCKPLGRRAYFWAAVISVALPVVVGALCLIDFDGAFRVFHAIFFPGKDNWMFDPTTDEIIEVMPEEFFMNCAIIIGVSLTAFAAALISADLIKTKLDKKRGEE